jgi:ATP-binding cassette subfamily B (MDR/TAP) protein 1
MALLFGRLTQDFVDFEMTLGFAQAGDASAEAMIPQAAASFRHSAAQNAIYFVILGSYSR